MGKPRNTRKYLTNPEIPEIPGNTRKKKRYPDIPDRIFRHSYPTRTRPDTRYFVQYPTRPDPILKNPTRWALVPLIPDICHGRHGRRPCKFFLAGVNFYRFNAKNWHFRQILREKMAFFYRFNAKNWRFSV